MAPDPTSCFRGSMYPHFTIFVFTCINWNGMLVVPVSTKFGEPVSFLVTMDLHVGCYMVEVDVSCFAG